MTGYVLPLRKYKILEAALAASFFTGIIIQNIQKSRI